MTRFIGRLADIGIPSVNAGIAAIVSMLTSSLESHIRTQSGQGLFGVVNVN